jgi:O-antigen/teichoic acid export membrane protein
MPLIRKNIIANLIGSAWVALISIAFIPLYLHFMGMESYGLVGFYLTLQALFSVLDMGLTATVSRELARLSSFPDKAGEMRDLVRTLEVIYWAISLLILLFVALFAPWIASEWLNVTTLSNETVQLSLILMGVMIALRMPYGFYSGVLLGLQSQVLLNSIKIIVETLKSGGAVLILWLVSPSIVSFFIWQLMASIIGLCLMAAVSWQQLPSGGRSQFQFSILRGVWRFTAGMSGIAITAMILTQSDKIMLSKMLSLEVFAYYALASSVALGLYVIISPIFSAVYPKLSQLVANNDNNALIMLYHNSCQLMTVIVMPIALVICFYSENLLQIWIQDTDISSQAAPLLSLLIIGTAMNGMMNIPYALQLAYGRPKLIVYMNITAIIVLLPPLMWAASVYGALGGALIWLILNIGYVVLGVFFIHQNALKTELLSWVIYDVGLPSLSAFVVTVTLWSFLPRGMEDGAYFIWIFVSYLLALIATLLTAANMRNLLVKQWKTNLSRD